jgi:hypothetical protein
VTSSRHVTGRVFPPPAASRPLRYIGAKTTSIGEIKRMANHDVSGFKQYNMPPSQ